jgi:Uma2 family endonuclease
MPIQAGAMYNQRRPLFLFPGVFRMATATISPPAQSHDHDSILLHGVRWSTYVALLEDMGNRHIRLTYDNGSLEIMTLSGRHERSKTLIGRMIEAMTEELNIPLRSGGSTTFKNELLQKGLEPDECYWVANEPAVHGRLDLDVELDPPPDIAVEVEISTSVLDRLGIYAALGVSEIWRSDGHGILVMQLQGDGTYRAVTHSPSFPWLSLAELSRFLRESAAMGETTWIRAFRAWVRAELAPLVSEHEHRQE